MLVVLVRVGQGPAAVEPVHGGGGDGADDGAKLSVAALSYYIVTNE